MGGGLLLAAALFALSAPRGDAANVATRVWFSDADVAAGAACLDGSRPALYVKPSAAEPRKLLILFKGGGWCYSDAECAQRAKGGGLGRSTTSPPTLELSQQSFMFGEPFEQLDNNETANPFLAPFTKIFVPYCDGSSWTSDLSTPVTVAGASVYYRGAANRRALLRMLAPLLAGATDVVVSGGSAGALSAYLHADEVAALVPSARTVALPDSGFFLEYAASGAARNYVTNMQWVASLNASLPAACVAANAGNASACIFAQNVVPHMKTPVFALNSEYDSFQVSAILDNSSPAAINAYGALFTATLTERLRLGDAASPHGAFVDSCSHHTRNWNTMHNNNAGAHNATQATAFAAWYARGAGARGGEWWHQSKPYPCKECCK